jgi:proteasome alpha subunit
LTVALAALAGRDNGETDFSAAQLEVAVLARDRRYRTFQRLTGARLAELLAASGAATGGPAKPAAGEAEEPGGDAEP